jgi:hypothetical protein
VDALLSARTALVVAFRSVGAAWCAGGVLARWLLRARLALLLLCAWLLLCGGRLLIPWAADSVPVAQLKKSADRVAGSLEWLRRLVALVVQV